ncbi:MAG: DUF3261 domain-containing protein [Nannocystaceae bacterium]
MAPAPGEADRPNGRAPGAAVRESYPGRLRTPTVMQGDFMWRQRVTARWEAGSRGFDAVLQKQGGVLTLLGLTPMGTAAFVIVLDGGQLSFDNHTHQELPFPPRYIMLDVQRVFFPWLAPGQRQGRVGNEYVEESWIDGRLTQRTFRRLDDNPAGKIQVTYNNWERGAAAPREAVLDNLWFGYQLIIETISQERLSDRDETASDCGQSKTIVSSPPL